MAGQTVLRILAGAVFAVAVNFSFVHAQPGLSFEGTFESGRLDGGKWYLKQIREPAIETRIVRSGQHALRLEGASHFACATDRRNCIRNQIREHKSHQLPIGTAAWYGLSLRVEGTVARRGSIRTVLAEWKEHGGASPFAALRYDNGVFHLTVQDNRCRRLVTMGAERAEQLFPETSIIGGLGVATATLTAGRMDVGTGTYLRSNTNTVRDPGPLNCRTSLKIENFRPLPDPFENWVDLALFIKRDRVDGLVEIWADGELAGRASGPIGNDGPTRCGENHRCRSRSDATQYFKAGPYGDICSTRHSALVDAGIAVCRRGSMSLYVDNIRRGGSRTAVDPALIDPR